MNIFKKHSPSEDQNKAQNLNKFHGEAAASSVYNAGAAYQNPSLIATGAEPQNLAMLGVFSNLILSFFFIKAPGLIARLGTVKKSILILSVLTLLGWVPLVWLFFNGQASSTLLILLFILNALPIAILAPLRDSWLASLVPGASMGRYFGLRSIITSVAYLVTFYGMGYMLDLFKENTLPGFAIIFGIASTAMLVSTLIYKAVRTPPDKNEIEDDGFDFLNFLEETKQGNLGAFVVFLTFFTLGVSIASPFFSVYMLRDLNLSYLSYTVILSSEYIARIVASVFWGKYADKAGSLKVLRICSNLIPIVPIMWVFARTPIDLIALHLFSGALWAGYDLCSATFIYKSASSVRRLKYIMYEKSLNTLATAAGNLAGTYLLSVVLPIFGNPILTMFLLSGIARFFVVRIMMRKLVDLTVPEKPEKKVLKPVMTRSAIPAGLYYRPDQWVKARESPTSYKVPAENLFTATRQFRPALYRDPGKWEEYAHCLKQGKAVRFRLDKVGIPVYPGASAN